MTAALILAAGCGIGALIGWLLGEPTHMHSRNHRKGSRQ